MLNIANAIRVENEVVIDPRGPYKRQIWIFLCDYCGKEMRKQKSSLKTHTGKCVKCVKRNNHPYQNIYNRMIASALKMNRDITLTFEEFLTLTNTKKCVYCNTDIIWKEYQAGASNLDRKNSDQGYHLSNVVVCCFECNKMKSNWYSYEEFLAIRNLLNEMRS